MTRSPTPFATAAAPRDPLSVVLGAALVVLILGWTAGLTDRVAPWLGAEGFVALTLALAVGISLGAGAGHRSPLRLAFAGLAVGALALLGFLHSTWQVHLVRPDAAVVTLGVAALVAVMAATARQLGWVLPGLLMAITAFCLWIGPDLSERFATRHVSPQRLIAYLSLDTNGLLSRMTYIAAATVAPFVLFGALFAATGAGAAITRPLHHLFRHCHAGAAKAAVLGSAAFGMISGSAVANVATSGPVTIPLMREDGMSAEEAASVEAAASTYGQIMPPVMGASAFLMAEWLGLPYAQIALAALAPAMLGYLSLILMIDFGARAAARAPAGEAVPALRLDPRGLALALLPFAVLAHALFFAGVAPGRAALLGCATIVAVQILAAGRSGFADAIRVLLRGGAEAVPAIVGVLLLGASAALLMGLLNVSGAGFMLTVRMIDLAHGSFAILAVLTALLTIVLGFGMPTVGVYLVGASLCAPALATAGADPLSAHLFILIFGVLSMVTPPVGMASYAAAMIAGAGTWATGRAAFRLGVGLAVIGVAVLIEPALLRPLSDPGFLPALIATALALVMMAAAATGHVALPLTIAARAFAVVLAAALLTALDTTSPVLFWSAAIGATLFTIAHTATGRRLGRQITGSQEETS